MARTVPLSTLRTRVRQRSNFENASTFITDAEITDHINESWAELYDLIRAAWGQDYFRSTDTFSTVGNTASYALPADFLSLISVDVPLGSNLVLTARPFMENERNRFKTYPFGAWTLHQPLLYRLAATNITFIPTPTGAYTVNLNYIPTSPVLVNPTDTADGVGGWEEYVVLDAAIKCLIKSEDPEMIQILEARKAVIRQRIDAMGTERDAGQPERVHDVYNDDAGDDW